MRQIRVIDSHTAGEPTRLVIAGGPTLGDGPLVERLERFRSGFDDFRSAVVNEPRGSNALVGALLCEPHEPGCSAGVIFFNNVGYLGMCGHGTIGLGATLRWLGRAQPGIHRIDTPVGVVTIELHESGEVTVGNVVSYRSAKNVCVTVPGIGDVTGDVAWGGNWFFLTHQAPCALELRNLEQLTDYTWRIRQALTDQGVTGAHGGGIDHIEVFGDPYSSSANGRSFVLCPGKEYDRSPCGTGTSAKLACLYEDGVLAEGVVWRQESVIGTVFEGSVSIREGQVHPFITGSAYVTADSQLILQDGDPFQWGIRG